jgi:hypothetical protein
MAGFRVFQLDERRETQRKVTKIWTTRDGRKLRICDMSDSHLIRAIKLCERSHRAAQLQLPYPEFNGEMAQFYAESDWMRFQDSGPEESAPLYLDLCAEADRRGLEH